MAFRESISNCSYTYALVLLQKLYKNCPHLKKKSKDQNAVNQTLERKLKERYDCLLT